MKIGIIGAMDVEVEHLKAELMGAQVERVAGTDFCSGRLGEKDVVVVKCGIGKVNAGICAQVLADHFGCTHLINTGVAGGIGEGVKIGNMVVASHTVQYDYDTTAIGEPKGFVMIGSEGVVQLPTSAKHNAVLEKYAEKIYNGVHTGVIATGDRFVADCEIELEVPVSFGGELLPPMRMTVKVSAGYAPRF